jgi:hypothetical protein
VTCTKQQAVASRVLLPASKTDRAIDLDGDGKADNGLGALLGALASQGTSVQGTEDAEVTQGKVIVLFDVSSTDAGFASDPGAATAHVFSGAAQASPKLDGTGAFTVDGASPSASLRGAIANGAFESTPAAPSVTSAPVVRIGVALLGTGTVVMPLYVARLTVTHAAGKATAAQINGAYKQSDVQGILIPGLAANITAQIKADPASPSSASLKSLFDAGGCTSSDGMAAVANDGVVAPCEVAKNALLQSSLAPDARLFDDSGAYHPSTTGAKNALTVALGFTLTSATF